MAIYIINQLTEGPIVGITASRIVRFGAGNGGTNATPATVSEVQNTISIPSTENNKYITLFNLWKWFEKVNRPQIKLSAGSINTTQKDSDNFSQNGKSVIIDYNGNTTVTVLDSSEVNFVALYIKQQTGNLTFVAGTNVTIIQVNGTNVATPNTRVILTRVGDSNTFLLYA